MKTPVKPDPMKPVDPAAVRSIQHDHARAVDDVLRHVRWLRQACDEAERDLDSAHTPGNITRSAGCLDAAREKAFVLANTLKVLGAYVPPNKT